MSALDWRRPPFGYQTTLSGRRGREDMARARKAYDEDPDDGSREATLGAFRATIDPIMTLPSLRVVAWAWGVNPADRPSFRDRIADGRAKTEAAARRQAAAALRRATGA